MTDETQGIEQAEKPKKPTFDELLKDPEYEAAAKSFADKMTGKAREAWEKKMKTKEADDDKPDSLAEIRAELAQMKAYQAETQKAMAIDALHKEARKSGVPDALLGLVRSKDDIPAVLEAQKSLGVSIGAAIQTARPAKEPMKITDDMKKIAGTFGMTPEAYQKYLQNRSDVRAAEEKEFGNGQV